MVCKFSLQSTQSSAMMPVSLHESESFNNTLVIANIKLLIYFNVVRIYPAWHGAASRNAIFFFPLPFSMYFYLVKTFVECRYHE